MTLSDLKLPISYDASKGYALVFGEQMATRLQELHAQYGRPDCIASPRVLVDGRFMLSAALLTAIHPGGWLHEMWTAADKGILGANVEVMPWADAVALLPPDPSPF